MGKQEKKEAAHKRRIAGLIHEPALNWKQVNDIRRTHVLRSPTHGTKAMAARYEVSPNTIHKIVYGRTWKGTEGDGNVPAPLAHRRTTQAVAKAYVELGRRAEILSERLRQLQHM